MSNYLGLFWFSETLFSFKYISNLLIIYFTEFFLFFRSSDVIVSKNKDEEENDELSVSSNFEIFIILHKKLRV